jgi:hypothetical protein
VPKKYPVIDLSVDVFQICIQIRESSQKKGKEERERERERERESNVNDKIGNDKEKKENDSSN